MPTTQTETVQDSCDYFAGWLPAYAFLGMHLDGLERLLSRQEDDPESLEQYEITELSYVGLVGYTEAFFKDHFASIINMFPELLSDNQRFRDSTVSLGDILMLEGPVRASCGFLFTQKQDFGSPDKVNGLFHDLLRVTPFSKEEVAEFNDVLKKRNLLVHHGGIYTTAFLRDMPRERRARIFTDAFQLSRPDVFRLAALINEIALATARRTQTILRERFPEKD